MAGSAVNLQQLLRMQGLVWGDSATHDFHIWFEGGTLYTDARITAVGVGQSLKTLLNFVPATLVANVYPTTALSGTGATAATAFTVTGLPSTAVAASIQVIFLPGSGFALGDRVGIRTNTNAINSNLTVILQNAGFAQASACVVTPVTPGATNQLAYIVNPISGGNQWDVSVILLGWYEPA